MESISKDDSRNGSARLYWLEELIPKEIDYCPEHRNPTGGVGQKHKLFSRRGKTLSQIEVAFI